MQTHCPWHMCQTLTLVCFIVARVLFKCLTLTRWTFIFTYRHIYLQLVLWQLMLTYVSPVCVISCPFVVSRQVGEIEEQLAAARREVTKSEEANQKLQREVKEVCLADLSVPSQDRAISAPGVSRVYLNTVVTCTEMCYSQGQ